MTADETKLAKEGGEPAENLEIRIEESHVVFHARSRSMLRAFRDGVELP